MHGKTDASAFNIYTVLPVNNHICDVICLNGEYPWLLLFKLRNAEKILKEVNNTYIHFYILPSIYIGYLEKDI